MDAGLRRTLIGVALLGTAACAPSSVSVPDPVELTGPRTWYGSVAPLVAARCAICHRADDIGPFPLETLEDVQPRLPMIRSAVAANRMPPFPPEQSAASGCPKISDVRQMTEAERAYLLAWIDEGAPVGDKRELPRPRPNKPLGDPTDRWTMTRPYASTIQQGDDYRCFLVQPNLLTAIPVGAVSVEPGNRAIVHHSAVYLVPPSEVARIKAMDAADDGDGYRCFGGVGVEIAFPAGLWVPGNDAPLVPPHPGVGYFLPVGWAFVLQQHYNYTGPAQTDQSSIVLWRSQAFPTEIPHSVLIGDLTLSLPPMSMQTVEAVGSVVARGSIPALNVGTEGRIYAVWGHMHLLGRSLEMDLVRADGTEQKLLHIPKWSFHWQSLYRLEEMIVAKAGDKIRVRCRYENSSAQTVSYGEGTADEMCFGAVAMLDP
ncbi:MAG: hypothetical protein H6Q89_4679 [Myxococcaceae bacterium]|nr:hypothetical protein [Myxococcaceae bacterium]